MCELGTSDRRGVGTYSDYREEDANGVESCFNWGDTRDILRVIHGLDGHVQRGESVVPPLRPFGIDIHSQKCK